MSAAVLPFPPKVAGLAKAGPMQSSTGLTIEVGEDGSVEILHPAPAYHRRMDDKKFDQNLASVISDGCAGAIAEDLYQGVQADILSRSEFIANYNKGIDLLGLKLGEASSVRGNRQSISQVKNPSLLKACMRSQSNSRGQMLPAAGPCKVQTISGDSDGSDTLALHFQQDFNYFLTHVDKGYYPDTDRMLFYRAFGGSAYKKVFRDPILKRPCSRFTSLDSLIVSENATDLTDALRKTNELEYSPIEVARMQALGGWLDVDLGTPMDNLSPARRKILESQGLARVSTRSQDISHTIYESYVYLVGRDYGIDDPKAPENMPVPYRVTMDRDSRKILAMHRNWKPKDEAFLEKQVFVKYGLVPGLGFLDYGFLHLIGNQTRVLTAIWQIMVDKGMLSNFPGGLKVKGVRTQTNELNPGLGEWAEVDIGSLKSIKDALMGMPYGDISQGFMQLAEMISKDIDSVAGTLEIPTGEGTSNTPVGTILAMIEQQSQDLTAVQQRDHRAQEEELRMIRDLFVENPEDLKHLARNGSKRNWADMVSEFSDMDLVPASDPNIPSQAHRILQNQFLTALMEKAPQIFGAAGLRKGIVRALTGAGISDGDDYLPPVAQIQQAMSQPPPGKGGGNGAGAASLAKAQMEMPIKQAQLAQEQQKIALKGQENQRQAANEAGDQQLRREKQQADLAAANARLEHEQQVAARDHMMDLAENQMGPEDLANLQKTKAQTFAAMGQGAMGFAKAGETVAQGERDSEDFENGTENGREVPEPAPKASLATAGSGGKKAKPKKGK